MAARIDAAKRTNVINGGQGPSYGTYSAPPPGAPSPPPGFAPEPPPQPQAAPPNVVYQHSTAVANCRPETRALVALSYPFWPLALLALLDNSGSHFVKRQAWQALGFSFAMYGLSVPLLGAISAIPLLGWSAIPLLPFIVPVAFIASVIYGFRVWHGEDVNVPIISDLVDARLPAQNA